MEIIIKKEFLKDKKKAIELIKTAILVYPTDTIYGIGCNAEIPELINKIRDAKQRPDTPFSVIAPSKEWMAENLVLKPEQTEWIDRLPGPYTLILQISEPECVSESVTADKLTLGVRIPDNWFSKLVAEAGVPFITTSVNVHGTSHITEINQVPEEIAAIVDFAIDDAVLQGTASTIVDLTKSPPEILKR